MRYYITVLVICGATLSGCAHRSQVAVSATSDTPKTFMSSFGEFSPSHSPWTVRVSEGDGRIAISRRTQFGSTEVSPSTWKAELGWFAFVENEQRVWAYDGKSDLYLLTWTEDGTASYHRSFPCPVPDKVFASLPASARGAVETHD